MTRNIIIAILTVFLLVSLGFAHIQKVRADEMAVFAEQKRVEAEEQRTMAQHTLIQLQEALKEAAFQREQVVQQVALLEAELQQRSRGK